MSVVNGDLRTLVSQRRRELVMGAEIESDLDIAFRLQLQEALVASLADTPSSSTTSNHHLTLTPLESAQSSLHNLAFVQSQELDMFEQEKHDRKQCEYEMKKLKVELDRIVHDRLFAAEIDEMSDDEWDNYGDNLERPYGEGPSKRNENFEYFRLYFKGLLSVEIVRGKKEVFAGIGIALCDPYDNPIFELRKPLCGHGLNRKMVEFKALVEGLNAALTLGIKRITFFCDYFPLYQYVRSKWGSKQNKVISLVRQISQLGLKFESFRPVFVARNDNKFAFKLAREAIISQVVKTDESVKSGDIREVCVICLEDTSVQKIFTVDGCLHRFCFSCMKQHVEVKLLHGVVPICPSENCKSVLGVESCAGFLTPKFLEMMRQRAKEASIPVAEKVYCPYPTCSALMSRSDVTEYSKNVSSCVEGTGARKCMKCFSLFCINCKSQWHTNMTCDTYKKMNPFPRREEARLKSLASFNLWRQCDKCNHMIELSEGCYHITCRCGYEFCYICGAEWKEKKATCTCPLWDEENIIHLEEDEEFDDEDFEDDSDDDFEDSDFDDDLY